MALVELEIFDIDNSKESKETYALILKEKNGDRFFLLKLKHKFLLIP